MSSMVTGGHHHHHHHHPASSYPYMFHHPPPDSLYNHPVSSSPRVPCQPAPAHSVNANTHPAAYPTSTHHASNTSPGATGTGNLVHVIRKSGIAYVPLSIKAYGLSMLKKPNDFAKGHHSIRRKDNSDVPPIASIEPKRCSNFTGFYV